MSTTKIEGLNAKEQKLYNVLKDGEPHDIRELKKLFWNDAKEHCAQVYEKGWGEGEIDSQAQSYVRNSVRRLVRDGWVDGPAQKKSIGRGTYQLSKKGTEWTKQGVVVTASAKKEKPKKEAKAKKAKAPKAPKKAKEPKKAKAPKAPKAKKEPKAKKAATKKAEPAKKAAAPVPANGDPKAAAKKRAKEAALRAAKGAAKEKAAEASKRATDTIKEEAAAE